jgi:rhodanese-related sulfurtransferase
MEQILPRQLADWLADTSRSQPLLLDVREGWEYERYHLAESQHIPMHLVPIRCEELPINHEIVVICQAGGRSMQVAMFLERKGFNSIHNLMGGVSAWSSQIDCKPHN